MTAKTLTGEDFDRKTSTVTAKTLTVIDFDRED